MSRPFKPSELPDAEPSASLLAALDATARELRETAEREQAQARADEICQRALAAREGR